MCKTSLDRWLSQARPFHLETIWTGQDEYETVRLPKLAWLAASSESEKKAAVESDDLILKHISGAFYALTVYIGVSLLFFGQELVGERKEEES